MPNYLTTTMASGISGSFTALQELQNETNQAAVIDLQLNKDLSETTSAEIKAQLNFTMNQAANQMSQGWSQMAGYLVSAGTSLGALGLGELNSPKEPTEPQPVKTTIELQPPSEDPNEIEMKDLTKASTSSTKSEETSDVDEKGALEGVNEKTVNADNKAGEEAVKAKAADDAAEAKKTWQHNRNATLTTYNTFGQALGQVGNAITAPITSAQKAAETRNQGYAQLATGGLQNIQTAQSTINSALEQQRGQASAAAQAEISIIQAGHPIAG